MAVKLLDMMSDLITFEKTLSVRVLERVIFLVDCKIKGMKELEARESCSLQFKWLRLK